MRQTLRILLPVAFCLLMVCSIGCTRTGRYRTRASGFVTANGQPLSVGKISFRPINGGKTHIDAIRNGSYSIRSRYAMSAGEYEVTIDYSSSKNGFGGADRHHAERVMVDPFGTHHLDFRLK